MAQIEPTEAMNKAGLAAYDTEGTIKAILRAALNHTDAAVLFSAETTRFRAIVAAQAEVIRAEREEFEAEGGSYVYWNTCFNAAEEARAALARLLAEGEADA
jgi:hypothetical protein